MVGLPERLEDRCRSVLTRSRIPGRCRGNGLRNHLVAERGAVTTGFRTLSAEGMTRSLLFAEPGAELTHFCTECADPDAKGRVPAHPLRRQEADVRAVTAESDAPDDHVIGFFMPHPDHVVCAGVAVVRAIHARLDTFDGMLLE